jgi:hypothetical protein
MEKVMDLDHRVGIGSAALERRLLDGTGIALEEVRARARGCTIRSLQAAALATQHEDDADTGLEEELVIQPCSSVRSAEALESARAYGSCF